MSALKTTVKILKDPQNTQAEADKEAAELEAKIQENIQHPTAVVTPRPQDTQPLNPMATKVIEHQAVDVVETAPGVQAQLTPQEPAGSTRVTLHTVSEHDQPARGAMGLTRMVILDDPAKRQELAEGQEKAPQLEVSFSR